MLGTSCIFVVVVQLTLATFCNSFMLLHHFSCGVGGGDVVRSERANAKMSCAHHMPLHTQEIGKKKAIRARFGEKISVGGGGACFFFREGRGHWHGGGGGSGG